MREILFRGKLERDGEWGEGNLFIPGKVTRRDVPTEILLGTNIVRISYEGDHSTVGQYTGLCDKNGKKIFEGDILSGYLSSGVCVNGLVEFKDGSFGISWKWGDGRQFAAFTSITHSVEFEIIGSIHDNPELLEVSHA